MAKENRTKIAKSSIAFAASVPLSKMFKLDKVIVPKVDIVTLPLEKNFLTETRWLEPFQATFLAKAISGIVTEKEDMSQEIQKRQNH